MLKEYHYDHLIRWPNNERAAVFLTFDFQGGEDVKPDKNGILNYEMWSQGEYGPHHAIYRILKLLKEEEVSASFLTCGAIALSPTAPRGQRHDRSVLCEVLSSGGRVHSRSSGAPRP